MHTIVCDIHRPNNNVHSIHYILSYIIYIKQTTLITDTYTLIYYTHTLYTLYTLYRGAPAAGGRVQEDCPRPQEQDVVEERQGQLVRQYVYMC